MLLLNNTYYNHLLSGMIIKTQSFTAVKPYINQEESRTIHKDSPTHIPYGGFLKGDSPTHAFIVGFSIINRPFFGVPPCQETTISHHNPTTIPLNPNTFSLNPSKFPLNPIKS